MECWQITKAVNSYSTTAQARPNSDRDNKEMANYKSYYYIVIIHITIRFLAINTQRSITCKENSAR